MTALRRAALFLLAFLLLLIVFAPLRFALDRIGAARLGLAAAEIGGTVWSGRMTDASFHKVRLGDLRVGLRPLPLLLGRTRLVLETLDRPGRGVLIRGGGRSGVSDATMTVPLELPEAPVPLRGELKLRDVSVIFRDGACEEARGRVATDLLVRNAEFLQWQGPELSGEIACRGDAVLIPLRGARAGSDVSAALSLEATGRYRLQTRVVTQDLALATALVLAGFQRSPEGLTRVDAGQFR